MLKIQIKVFFILLTHIFATQNSTPLALQPDPTYLTGTSTLITTNMNSTSPIQYTLNYPWMMSTASLNGSLGIIGVDYYMKGIQFGWNLGIVSLNNLTIVVQASVYNNNSLLYYLNICYMVTYNSYLDLNYVTYTFSSTDSIDNYSIPSSNCTFDCRLYSVSQSYRGKANAHVITFLAGFTVNGMGVLGNGSTYFGISLDPSGAGTSSFTMNIYVYGAAQISSVSYYYLSFDSGFLNVINYRTAMDGRSSLGCAYSSTTCNPIFPITVSPSSNTSFNTGTTSVQAYTPNMFFIGIDRMIANYAGDTSTLGQYNITSFTQNSDTSIGISFVFNGNVASDFHVAYSYFTLQTFYCSSSGVDIYYVYNSNQCASSCNGSIQQYANATNFCQLCGVYCWTCVGSPTYCTACYNSQNRVLSGNLCICDFSGGFYDDGTSVNCVQCDVSCKTCSGPGSASCLTCNPAANRYQNVNSCPCNPGYYSVSTSICQHCHYTCYSTTCTAGTSTTCASCNSANHRQLLSDYSCGCMTGYYDNGTNSQLCSPCVYSCLTCSGSNTFCTSCNGLTNYRTLSSNNCVCMPGYYDSNTAVCQPCHVTCQSCNGPLNSNCLSCNGGLHRSLVGSTCYCQNGFFDFNNTCNMCYFACGTCSDGSSTSCLTCNPADYRLFNSSSGQCYCQSGYVDMNVQACQQCSASCLTCAVNTYSCTSCLTTPGRYKAGFSCLCSTGYVDIYLNGTCSLCHYSCITCTSATSAGCSTCTTNRILTFGSCLCPAGTYDTGNSSICLSCASTCSQCTNGLASGCTACNSIYFRTLNPSPTGTCICQIGYYDVGVLTCLACYQQCLSCWSSSTNCTSCDSVINHRTITASDTCQCMAGYYETGGIVCLACSSPCLTCSLLPNNCTSCNSDRTLLGNLCICNSGTFQNVGGSCQSCYISCLTCVTTSTTCTSCPSGANRYSFGTSCPCNIGYFDVGVVVCSACPYYCQSCSGSTVCINCPTSSFRTLQINGSCTCNSGYYDNGASAICIQCSAFCVTCSSFSQCLSCDSTLSRIWDSVDLTCPCSPGSYDNLVPLCVLCHYSCATCFGAANTACYSCTANRTFANPNTCPCTNGFYESSQICTPCSLICSSCSQTSTNCTSCSSSNSFLSNYQCFCNSGFYMNGLSCFPCNSTCLTCSTTSTNCLSCNLSLGTVLNGSSCVCSSAKYSVNGSLICLSCHFSCSACSLGTNSSCLSCANTSYRTFLAATNSCPCIIGYYDSGVAICSKCSFPCAACFGPSTLNCSSCQVGYWLIGSSCMTTVVCSNYFYQGYCLNTCPNTTYQGVNQCITCQNNCLTCYSNISCTSCLSGYNFYNSTCIVICPNGTYISINSICAVCPAGCTQCVNRSTGVICISCQNTLYMMGNTCNSCSVADNTHILIGNVCYSCLQNCTTCTNISSTGCLACKPKFSFYQGMCLSVCPDWYYSFNNQCVICNINCSTCNATGCSMCKDGFYLSLKGECISIGFFVSSQGYQTKCHPNCLTCTNSSFSSCIACVSYRGDNSQMAISGYCDCWKGSIDLGDGTCDRQTYKAIYNFNQILVSFSSSVNYFLFITGVISLNLFAPLLMVTYQQVYSNFYYLNASAVMQTDLILDQYNLASFNRLVQQFKNQDSSGNSHSFGRRLEISTQQIESLFMRGYNFQYLIQWALFTFIAIIAAWLTILLLMYIVSRLKAKAQNSKQSKLLKISSIILCCMRQSALILIHFLTINEITLYGIASFTILANYDAQISVLKLLCSIIIFLYYFIYLVRLIIACYKVEENDQKCSLLFACFEMNKQKILHRIYIPMVMIRSVLLTITLVVFSFSSSLQIGISFAINLCWCIYSFFFCPYPFYLRLFIRIYELLFTVQLLLLTISIIKPEYSRIGPAIGLLVINFLQICSFAAMGILVLLNKFYNIKCLRKQNLIQPTDNQQHFQENILANDKNIHNLQKSMEMMKTQNEIQLQQVQKHKMQQKRKRDEQQLVFHQAPTNLKKNHKQPIKSTQQSRPQQITRKRYRVKKQNILASQQND